MKKKFKLFATIASLCLAICVMVAGVYAATQSVTYTVDNNVQYAIDNGAMVAIKTDVYKLSNLTNAAAVGSIASASAAEDLGFKSTSEESLNIASKVTYTANDTVYNYNKDHTATGGSITFDFTKSYAYKVVITVDGVKNTRGVTVALGSSTLAADNNAWVVAPVLGTAGEKGARTVTYYVGLADATVPVETATGIGSVVVTVTPNA